MTETSPEAHGDNVPGHRCVIVNWERENGWVGMEGGDLLWRDKMKRERGCGSAGLYLDRRKITDREEKNTEKEPISNCGAFSGRSRLPCSHTWGGKEPAPGPVTGSEVRSAVGDNNPCLECCGKEAKTVPRTKDCLHRPASQRPEVGWLGGVALSQNWEAGSEIF